MLIDVRSSVAHLLTGRLLTVSEKYLVIPDEGRSADLFIHVAVYGAQVSGQPDFRLHMYTSVLVIQSARASLSFQQYNSSTSHKRELSGRHFTYW